MTAESIVVDYLKNSHWNFSVDSNKAITKLGGISKNYKILIASENKLCISFQIGRGRITICSNTSYSMVHSSLSGVDLGKIRESLSHLAEHRTQPGWCDWGLQLKVAGSVSETLPLATITQLPCHTLKETDTEILKSPKIMICKLVLF